MWGWILTVASLVSMRAAIDRGDVDEAARQGVLAGPSVVEQALAARDRPAILAGIAAAPSVVDREELLVPLARVAGTGDRRIAIPAARAAREIAHALGQRTEVPDDLAVDDVATWRAAWTELAIDRDRFIEVRIAALDTATALARIDRRVIDPDTPAIGVDLARALGDPDPAFRGAAIADLPIPVPASMRGAVVTVIQRDTDPEVALAAAAALCGDLAIDPPAPVQDALGTDGIARIRTLVSAPGTGRMHRVRIRDARRCLRGTRR